MEETAMPQGSPAGTNFTQALSQNEESAGHPTPAYEMWGKELGSGEEPVGTHRQDPDLSDCSHTN